MSRRSIQVFNMSFLDMITNFLGAVIILFLLAMVDQGGSSKAQFSPKFFGSVTVDSSKNRIFGDFDRVFRSVKPNDTILVVVKDFGQSPENGAKDATGREVVYLPCNKQHFPSVPCPPPCPPPGTCSIVASFENGPCNNGGTPSNTTDDTYTAKVTVKRAGECGTSWRDNSGGSGAYDVAKNYGPFRIADGTKELKIADANDAKSVFSLKIIPPPSCSETKSGPNKPTVMPPIEYGKINFVAYWGDRTNKINLWLRVPGGDWAKTSGGSSNGTKWSDYTVKSGSGPIKIPKQVGEIFYQDTPKPGTYEVWLHNTDPKRASQKVQFWASSKDRPATNVADEATIEYSDKSPKSGGGKLVMVIEVGADGSIRRIK